AYAGSTGNTLTFTYMADNAVTSGALTIAVPSGWSTPSTSASAAGATTSTCGTVGVSGSTIQVTGINLASSNTCTVTYGDKAGGPGATASSSGGGFTPATFTTLEKSSSGGTLTALGNGSPSVSVTANNGSGTMSVSPSTVITSSTGNDFDFQYTAPTGGLSSGKITLFVPTAWPTPSSSGFDANGISDSCEGDGNLPTVISVTGGSLITTNGVSLAGGATCDIKYGIQNFNPGVTAPSTNGPYQFTTQVSTWSGGTLTNIGTSPVITVGNDGTGTMTVSPSSAVAGSTGNTETFTYTAVTAVSNGELTIAVPSGWSNPSIIALDPGATTSTCGTVAVSGSAIDVTGVNLASNGACTVTYGNKTGGPGATAASAGGPTGDTFATQEKSSAGGTLITLGNGSPVVTLHALDGTGTMTVTPTSAINNSTGNDYDFTYTAPAGGLVNGELTLLVPTGWTTPSTSSSSVGGVSTSCGSGSFTITSVGGGSQIAITGVSLSGGSTCDVHYGIDSFNPGVTAPAGSGVYTFTAEEASSSTGALTNLSSSPAINVSTDGSGALAVSPQALSAGATGQTLAFTYTSGVSLANGEVSVAIPSGWSTPSTTGADPGYTTTDCAGGHVNVFGNSIHVTGITMGAGQSCSINYGATSSDGPGATVTAAVGAAQFNAQERSSGSGSLTDLASSPHSTVYAQDGSGTLTAAPGFVADGSGGNTLTFTYTAPDGGLSNGRLLVALPSGWSAPSTTPQVDGYTTSTCGSVAVPSGAIQVTGVSLPASGTCTITYGNRSSGGAGTTAPSTTGTQTFVTQEASTGTGSLANIASSPQVDITAADGSGTMAVDSGQVVTGSTGNTLTFTYTAATGGVQAGELTIDVPTGWSAPSTTATDPGSTTSDCGQVGLSGGTIEVTGVTLNGGDTCTVVYGSTAGSGPGATAPSSDGTSDFVVKEASTALGLLTSLAASPSVVTSTPQMLTVAVNGTGTVAGSGISCPGACSKSYFPGTNVSLTSSPGSGFKFMGWTGACSGTAVCHVTISNAANVTATFARITHALVVTVKGKGHVSGNGISCPGTCAKSYPNGTAVALTARPATGFRFAHWGGACTGTGICHRTMNSNASVTATFIALPACVVPKLRGTSLLTATQMLRTAHCALGKVTRPTLGQHLVVGSSNPAAGTRLPNGAKVAIRLVQKRG
ncbi:MAG: beta strand repeat-containing protein, partial [Solirubrobacteraceae bacterium]